MPFLAGLLQYPGVLTIEIGYIEGERVIKTIFSLLQEKFAP